jgi:hypothetical protein
MTIEVNMLETVLADRLHGLLRWVVPTAFASRCLGLRSWYQVVIGRDLGPRDLDFWDY